MLDLKYTNLDIKVLARKVKQTYKIDSLVQMVQYVFSDADIFNEFVRVGAHTTEDKADKLIQSELDADRDYLDVQMDVVEGLIASGFYKKELRAMLTTLQENLNQ
jgi:hypothetical protein